MACSTPSRMSVSTARHPTGGARFVSGSILFWAAGFFRFVRNRLRRAGDESLTLQGPRMMTETFLDTWHSAAMTALGLFWTAFWAFGLGYLISSMIQVFVTRRVCEPAA